MKSHFGLSCLLAVVAVASANPIGEPVYAAVGSIPSSDYEYNYAVNDPSTGDNKGQWESRRGDIVTGAYSLVEPDGNIRLVEYTADPIRGFNAVVKRTGPNLHSISVPAPVAIEPLAVAAPVVQEVPIAPIIDTSIVQPVIPQLDLPLIPITGPVDGPWVRVSGRDWGRGKVRRWASGPINLADKTVIIRTKN